MSFLDLAKARYSLRKYSNQEVEKEKLVQILEAGRVAPSAVNYQPLHFIVVTDYEKRQKISAVYEREWLKGAPVLIIICGNHNESWKRGDGKDHCDIDAAIATDHMTLAAADLGLGSCFVCAFDAKRCHEILDLPDYMEPIILLPVGYPQGERKSKTPRKNMDELVSWE